MKAESMFKNDPPAIEALGMCIVLLRAVGYDDFDIEDAVRGIAGELDSLNEYDDDEEDRVEFDTRNN